jgi:hypothetical protein
MNNRGVSKFLGGNWKQWVNVYSKIHHMALYTPNSPRYILYELIQARDILNGKMIPKNINYMVESAKEDYEVNSLVEKIVGKLDENEIKALQKMHEHELVFNQYTAIIYPNKKNLVDLLDNKKAQDTYAKIINATYRPNGPNYSTIWSKHRRLFDAHHLNEERDAYKLFIRLHRLDNSWVDIGSPYSRRAIGSFDMKLNADTFNL